MYEEGPLHCIFHNVSSKQWPYQARLIIWPCLILLLTLCKFTQIAIKVDSIFCPEPISILLCRSVCSNDDDDDDDDNNDDDNDDDDDDNDDDDHDNEH